MAKKKTTTKKTQTTKPEITSLGFCFDIDYLRELVNFPEGFVIDDIDYTKDHVTVLLIAE